MLAAKMKVSIFKRDEQDPVSALKPNSQRPTEVPWTEAGSGRVCRSWGASEPTQWKEEAGARAWGESSRHPPIPVSGFGLLSAALVT